MGANDNGNKTDDKGHIFNGMIARPVDDSFWRATNKKTPDSEPSPFGRRAAERQQGQNKDPAHDKI